MRRFLLYIGIALLAGGCGFHEFPDDNPVDPTLVNVLLQLSVDEDMTPSAKMEQSRVGETCDIRWTVEIFRDGLGSQLIGKQVMTCSPSSDGCHCFTMPLALHAAKYHFAVWADFVDKDCMADKHYLTENLGGIAIPTSDYSGNCETKEVFSGTTALDLTSYRYDWNATTECSIVLERPMARIELIATDFDKLVAQAADHNAIADPSSLKVCIAYAGYFPSGYNVYTGQPNDACTGLCFDSTPQRLDDGTVLLGYDYVFVNGTESSVTADLTITDTAGRELNRVDGVHLPIARGQVTSVSGEFLTRSFSPGVGIDPGFDGDIEVTIPD